MHLVAVHVNQIGLPWSIAPRRKEYEGVVRARGIIQRHPGGKHTRISKCQSRSYESAKQTPGGRLVHTEPPLEEKIHGMTDLMACGLIYPPPPADFPVPTYPREPVATGRRFQHHRTVALQFLHFLQ